MTRPAEELDHADVARVSVRFWISLASTVLVIGLALVVPQLGFAAGIAYAYSVVAVLWPELFPDALRGTHGLVTPYFTAATVIVMLALLVELLGARRKRRAGA